MNQQQSRSTRLGRVAISLTVAVAGLLASSGYVINNWWVDSTNIIVDDLFTGSWSSEAQGEMVEWNGLDTSDNTHAFRIDSTPEPGFGANDGDTTMGFLGEASLISEYGLDYSASLAWAACWAHGPGGTYDECDVMLDPTLAWSTAPHDSTWFQSTVLHELGHVRGLAHFNGSQSMMNSAQSKLLRDEELYVDDRAGVRQNATTVSERDLKFYSKWHDGTAPQWSTLSATTLRGGDTLTLENITLENLGNLSMSPTGFGIYLSTNSLISVNDTRLNGGFFATFGAHARSTFDWNVPIPELDDCSTRWIGGVADDNDEWSERIESNNDSAFSDGNPFVGSTYTPTPLTILLEEDAFEPNDTVFEGASISLPFSDSDLTIDQDQAADYFQFTLTQNSEVDITLDFIDSAGDLNLVVYNSSLQQIASASSTTNDETLTLQLAIGTYVIGVLGNGGGSCNRYGMDVGRRTIRPDMVVEQMSLSSTSAAAGGTVEITERVANTGEFESNSGSVGYFISTDAVCSTADTLLSTRAVPALDVNETSTATTTVTIPAGTSNGAYWLCTYVDHDQTISESNGSNNTRVLPFTVGDEMILFGDGFELGDVSAWTSSSGN